MNARVESQKPTDKVEELLTCAMRSIGQVVINLALDFVPSLFRARDKRIPQ